MKLPSQSYTSRVRHEGLYVFNITFGFKQDAIETLSLIKEFNIGKRVIHTCSKCVLPDNISPRYEDTVWKFAYDNEEDRNGVVRIIHEMDYEYEDCYGFSVNETVCPLSEVFQ